MAACEADAVPLHIGVLPWLATGHLTPFIHLSARLAALGHRVSFLSTPANLRRLPPNIHPVPLPPSLLLDVSSTADLSASDDRSLRLQLRRAFDTLSSPISTFLGQSSPGLDWLLCDYSPYWAPQIARAFNVKTAFVSLFNAAVLSCMGPTEELTHPTRLTPEDFTVTPKWVPFETTVAFTLHEARTIRLLFDPSAAEDKSEMYRFGATIRGCDIVAVRSCVEFEKEEIGLLEELYKKPVVPIGHFPPAAAAAAAATGEDSGQWAEAFEWLDKQAHGSVVYVAFGSEVRLQEEDVREIARGLELSGLPFIWALRRPNGPGDGPLPLPEGRGIVCEGWVPQVRILGHWAVGGFMTHCGWNSSVEALRYGRALVLLPMIFDQGLNARLLAERGVGREVPRNEEDGKFDAIGIANTLKMVMVEEEGEPYRAKARELKSVLGDEEVQGPYVEHFVHYLKAHRPLRQSNGPSHSLG